MFVFWDLVSHRIHGTGIFTYYSAVRINHPRISKYTGLVPSESIMGKWCFTSNPSNICWGANGQSEDHKFKIFQENWRVDYFRMLQWGFLKCSQALPKLLGRGPFTTPWGRPVCTPDITTLWGADATIVLRRTTRKQKTTGWAYLCKVSGK